jgi:hypothetical protein
MLVNYEVNLIDFIKTFKTGNFLVAEGKKSKLNLSKSFN